MDKEPDNIRQGMTETRHEMAETRAAMTEKIEALEERVRDTVEGAQSTGEDILENVKGTVDETVGTVKETLKEARSTVAGMVENVKEAIDDTTTMVQRSFDFTYQMDQHPWMMLSGAVLVGYVLGGLDFTTAPSHTRTYPFTSSQPRTQTSRLWDSTLAQFKEGLDLIKGTVISALMSNMREMVKQSWPAVAPQVEQAIENATVKLGGYPLPHGEQEKRRTVEPVREHREQPPLI